MYKNYTSNDPQGNQTQLRKGKFEKAAVEAISSRAKCILNILFLFGILCSGFDAVGQTLISPTGDGGFETGTTFSANGWTYVGSGTRTWQVGTAGGAHAGTRAAFAGAAANANGINSAVVHHFYRDILIPAGATNVLLNYRYKQTAVDDTFDYFYVSTTTTSNTPTSGTIPGAGYNIRFTNTATAYSAFTAMPQVDLTALAGTTVRLVFSFKSDGATPHVSPTVDSISLVYTAGSNCAGTPNNGTIAISKTSGCSGESLSLTSSGLTSAVGISYQWQTSPTNSNPWTDVATGTTFNPTSVAGTTYYRLASTCSFSSTTSYSNSVSFAGVACTSVNLPSTGSATVDCGSNVLLYDNGGPSGDYTNNRTSYVVLDNSGTGVITLSGSVTGLETCCDSVVIYRGVGTGGTVAATISAVGPITQIVSTPGQALTVQLISDVSNVGSGFAFQAIYSGTCLTCDAPVGGTASAVGTTFCASGSTTVSATGYSAGTGTRYQWESSTDNFATAGTSIGSVATAYANLATGTITTTTSYRLRVFCVASPGTPAYSNAVTVVVNTPSAITASTDNTNFCVGGSANLSVSGANTYSWTSNPAGFTSTSANPSVSPTSTTTYSVVGVDSNGCTTNTATTTVTVLSTPSAITVTPTIGSNPVSNNTVCDGTVVTLTSSGGTVSAVNTILTENFNTNAPSWVITNGGSSPAVSNWAYTAAPYSDASGSSTFSNFSTVNGGKFAYANSDAGGSGTTTNTILTSPAFSTVGFTSANLSFEQAFQSWTSGDATVQVEISTNGGSNWSPLVSYLGSSQGTTTNNAQTTVPITISLASYLNQANLKIRYNYVSTWGYYWILDNIVVNGNMPATLTKNWTASSGTLYTDAAATPGNEYVPNTAAAVVYARPSGTTTYTYTATNGSCPTEGSVTLNTNPLPVITLANNITVCKGTGATITIPENNNNYSWSPGTGLNTTTGSSVLANPNVTTTYTVTTTNTSNFCQSTNQITVNVNDPGIVAMQPADRIVASGFNTSFTVGGTVGITYGYQWQIKTGPSSYVNLSNNAQYSGVTTAVLSVDNAGSGTAIDGALYRAILTPPAPCANLVSNDALLTVSNTGIATSPADVNICLPTPSTAQFTVVTNGDEPYLVEWQVSTDNGATYNTISLIDVEDTFLYTGPNTTAVPGLTFEHPLDAGNPNGTGSEFKILNVSGITNPATLKFKAIVNEVLSSSVATLSISNPIAFTTNLATAEITRCVNPLPAAATDLSVTVTGSVTSVEWRYDTTPGGTFSNAVTNNTPAGSTYVASSAGTTYSLAITTNGSTPAGSYYYKAFVTGSAGCGTTPTQSAMATITVANPAVAIAASAAAYCSPGSAVTLTASGAATYSWTSTPAGFTSSSASVSVTPTVATVYSVIGTDANGCTNNATFNVGVGTSFTVAASAAPTTVCPNAAVALTAVPTVSGATTYLIDSIPYQFSSTAGTFTALTGTTVSSGLGNTDDDAISGNLTPGAGFSFNYGGTAYTTFRVSSNGQLIFGTSGTQSVTNDLASTTTTHRPVLAPLWDDTALSVGVKYQMNGTAPNRVLTVEWLSLYWDYSAAGAVISYQVKLYETTNVIEFVYQRNSTAYTSDTFGPTGGASIGLMGTALGNFLSLQDTTASPALSTSTSKNDITTKPTNGRTYRFTPVTPITYTYAWASAPAGFTATGSPATANPAVDTSYTVTATSSQGCQATGSASVTVNSAAPVVTPLAATLNLCQGATATFAVTATSGTPLTYVWKRNGTPLANGSGVSGATTATLTITGVTSANNGNYTVDVTNCTTVTSNATVLTVNPLPTATIAGTAAVCQNATQPLITFTAAAGTAPYTFTYTLNGGTNQTISTTAGNSVTIAVPTTTAGTFGYSLVSVQDSSSSACSQTQTGTATITVNSAPAAPVLTTNSPICAGNTLTLSTPNVLNPPAILSQNFESGLGTWTVTAASTGGTNPTVANFAIKNHGTTNSDASITLNSPGGTKFIFADPDGAGNGVALNTKLTSPSFSTVGYTAASLSFRHYHRYITTAPNVEVSTNNGSTWTSVASYSSTQGTGTNFATATISLNAYIGLPNVQVRFNYTGGWLYYWAIDDVSITGTPGPQVFTYAWTGPNSFSSAVQNPSITNATPAATGTYSLEITNANGCKATSTVTATVTAQPLWYLDADNDHYYTGSAIASCTSPGAGYTTAGILGGNDCNDADNTIYPNAPEICYNNILENCLGTLSQGCAPVVVNMTSSYDNTTLLSLSNAVPAVPYTYGTYNNLKYRFTITRLATASVPAATVSDIIQTSRYVNIPGSLHAYPGTYTITASAVINEEIVPYAGNTITVFAPTVQVITLSTVSCGATLASLSSTLSADAGPNATGYTFRIRLNDSNPTPMYATSQSATRFVGANSFTGFPLQYASSYKVSVRYTYNDPVTGLPIESPYGAECTVNTPSIPLTTMASPTCNGTAPSLNANMSATSAPYATGYRFRIRLFADNGPTPTYYYTPVVAGRFSSFTAFQGITLAYNTAYSISVEYSILNGSTTVWSGFGADCKVTTPTFPTTSLVASQCGQMTATSLTQQLNIIPYPGFPNYKVRIEEVTGEEVTNFQERVISYSYFRLNEFSMVQLGKNYQISVAIKLNGEFGDFNSPPCDIFTALPGKTITSVPFKATAYPNPFAENFMLDVKSESQSNVNIKVYDMIGRMIEQKDVRISDMESTTIGSNYPSGVYNVVVSQEDTVQTVRVVKR